MEILSTLEIMFSVLNFVLDWLLVNYMAFLLVSLGLLIFNEEAFEELIAKKLKGVFLEPLKWKEINMPLKCFLAILYEVTLVIIVVVEIGLLSIPLNIAETIRKICH